MVCLVLDKHHVSSDTISLQPARQVWVSSSLHSAPFGKESPMEPLSTHISVILDRTGSMEPIRDDTIGGYNAYLEKQKDKPGETTLTLIQFDSQDPYEVIYQFLPIQAVPNLTRETYIPRGFTPLYDAIGRGILDLDSSLANLSAEKHPKQVIMVIDTDGAENASHEFTKAQITRMIQEKQQQCDWQIVFLGADLTALDDAESSGIRATHVMAYDHTPEGKRAA